MKRKLSRQMLRRRNELRDAERTQTKVPRALSVYSKYLQKQITKALTILLTPNCSPRHFAEACALLPEQNVFDMMFDYNTNNVVILFKLRGQTACDILWGTGGLPSPYYRRQQIIGEYAAETPYAQAAMIPQTQAAVNVFLQERQARSTAEAVAEPSRGIA